MSFLLGSSVAAEVDNFVKENRFPSEMNHEPQVNNSTHPESSPAYHELGSTPQIDVQVHDKSSTEPKEPAPNKYQGMLRYNPNSDFSAEYSNINAPSVPNTFKHKGYPNAKTKSQIGLNKHKSSLPVIPNSPESRHSILATGIWHAASLSPQRPPDGDAFSAIDDLASSQWPDADLQQDSESHNQQDPMLRKQPLALAFLDSQPETLVHKPQNSQEPVATPMWRKATKDYQSQVNLENPPLQHIFRSLEVTKEGADFDRSNHDLKGTRGFQLLSTVSTPVAQRDTDIHLTQQQIDKLEDLLEQAKDKPEDFQIKSSPLKLFGNEYDTFTKAVLNRFVEKVRSNANSVQRTTAPVAVKSEMPKLRMKNSMATDSYTHKDFMAKADNIFANLQKKGFRSERGLRKPSSLAHGQADLTAQPHDTAMSTPKPQKVGNLNDIELIDGYSSYSSDFAESVRKHSVEKPVSEYTDIEETYMRKKTTTESDLVNDVSSAHSSYTFEEISDMESRLTDLLGGQNALAYTNQESSFGDDTTRKYLIRNVESPFVNPTQPQMENSREQNRAEPQDESQSYSAANVIKWKRPSQLRLLKDATNRAPSQTNASVRKGFVKPGEYQVDYGNMIFDSRNKRWIPNNDENEGHGSLDSIEDLDVSQGLDASDPSRPDASILKRAGDIMKKKAEVLFQVPDTNDMNTDEPSSFVDKLHNVTSVSEFNDVTFTQINKKLVSVITGTTNELNWEALHFIDLSNKLIDRVMSLDLYLPALKSVDLSNNKIEFIDGLPRGLFDLIVLHNSLGPMTTFEKYHDLHTLLASHNGLVSMSCLNKNINLCKVDLLSNKIVSLKGLEHLSNLMTLNLSCNGLTGGVDFRDFKLHQLRDLNLAENSIDLISGLQHLPQLTILNLNENMLETLGCPQNHPTLKKLLCKFNRLSSIDLKVFPQLRCLRIDGNRLENLGGLSKLKFLQELSAKCQLRTTVLRIMTEASDVVKLDLSGGTSYWEIASTVTQPSFLNLNHLNLSAAELQELPEQFGDMFPNVRTLNLNFNKLSDLKGLGKLQKLRKLYLLSNKVLSLEVLLAAMQGPRDTLKVLDLRLNAITNGYYPYVFSPDELQTPSASFNTEMNESPIPLQALDDIENFSIHYKALSKTRLEWQARDSAYLKQLEANEEHERVSRRLLYERVIISFFQNLRELDGNLIDGDKRQRLSMSV